MDRYQPPNVVLLLKSHTSFLSLLVMMASHSLLHLLVLCFCIRASFQTDGPPLLGFVKEPPGHVDFSNNTGTTVECVAAEDGATAKEGSPSVSWIYTDGSKVTNITGLRQIYPDGRMVFSPFSSVSFRQDVHAVTYHCLATGTSGTLLSSDVKVKAVMDVDYEANVYDVYAVRGNTAVVKCHVPQFLKDYVTVVSVIKDDTLKIGSNSNLDSKYNLTPYGTLYINDVDKNDENGRFKCQTYNRLTKQLKTSSSSGKLIMTYPQGKIHPKIADFMTLVVVREGENAFLPCVVQGEPTPQIKWMAKVDMRPVAGERFHINVNGLTVSNVISLDAGIYICLINNTVGNDQAEVRLVVKMPLKVSVLPQSQSVNVGSPISLQCKVTSENTSYKVKWIKDGRPLNMHKFAMVDKHEIRVVSVSLEDRGIYQCLVSVEEDDEHAQGSALVLLGKFGPVFKEIFSEETVQPGSSVALTCIVAGNPTPKTQWSLDGNILTSAGRLNLDERLTSDGSLMSTLTIKSAVLEDGGTYTCASTNVVGTLQHQGRINVYGPLKSRSGLTVSVVAGHTVALNCPIYGYPFDNVRWEKESVRLPIDNRQVLLQNWTLIIQDVQRKTDSGQYTCTASNKAQQRATGQVQLSVMVLPKIAPFAFQEELVREGMRAQIQCAISEGDTPITIQWTKDGHSIKSGFQDVYIHQVDEYSSNLAIRSVSPRNNGNYTCSATNKAGVATYTALLSVNALPKIIPFSFQDDQNFKGMRAHITCAVSQGDLPLTFYWLKDGTRIDEKASIKGVQVANYDQYSSFLSIQSVTSENSGNYTCVATNEAGKDSYMARLMVQVAPKIVPFNFQGENLLEGVFARVSCVVYQGDLPIQIFWNKDGIPIENKLKGANVRTVDDFTSILTIDRVAVEHSGNYSCVAKNSAASAIHVAQLVVKVPPKIVPFNFQEDELAEGTYVRLSCVVGRGDLPLNFTWTKDESQSLPEGVITRQIDDYSSVLSIDRVSLSHGGVYTCSASNAAASTAHSSTLRVYVPPSWLEVPNADVFTSVGNIVSLTCLADGYPKPVTSWMIQSDLSNRKSITSIPENDRFKVYQNGTLIIERIEESDTNSYLCKASNGIGEGLNRIINLIVKIPVSVVNRSHDTVARIGQPMTLRCVVRGDKPINSTWTVDGKPIPSNNNNKHNQKYTMKQMPESGTGMTVVELAVASVTKLDNALYGCSVHGKHGQDEATIKVTIEGPPETPTELSAVSKGDNTVEVTWKQPFDNHSPIARYIILYEAKNGHLLNRTTLGSETKIVLDHLQPSSTYHIAVHAENANGRSESPGTVQIVLAGEAPSGVPESIVVHPHNGRSLRVSWQPPLRSTWNGAILGYYVGYREASTGQPYEYHLLEIPEGYDRGLSFTLNDLKEFTSYSVVVQAFNEHGKGPLSEEVLAMTSEGVPSRPPMAIDCSPTSSQTVVVSWEQPQEAYIHGILRGYKVLYWTPDSRNGANNMAALSIQNTTEIKVTLRGLVKFANYSIQVLAYTFAGDGVASKPIYCHTLEDVPSAPREIKSTTASQDSVHISWSPPTSANGIIIHYTIYVQEANPGQERFAKHRETRLVLNGNKTHHQVRNLRRGQRYAFHVTASTSVGEGASTKTTEIDLASIGGNKIRARITAFGDTVKQSINKAVVLPCPVTGQPTPKRSWLFRGETVLNGDPRISVQPDGALQITTLYHSDTGNYTCHVQNDYGEDRISYELYVKVPPSAPSLLVTSTTFMVIEIAWKPPVSTGNAPILGYVLSYKQEFGPWSTVELQPYMTSHTVTGLHCGSTYQMHLTASNEVGVGQSSETVSATTAGGIPNVPSKEKLIEERTGHAVIHLDSWESNGCPILYFVIEYKQRTGRSWSLLSNDLRPNRPSILLEKLQPGTLYSLRMAAHTSAGSAVIEYEFSTLEHTESEMNDGDGVHKLPGFLSIFDFNVLVTILSCSTVVLLCLSITCFWVRRHKNNKNRPVIGSTSSLRPRSKVIDDDDEISPYAMVKLSDIQKQQPGPSGEKRRPKSAGATPKSASGTPQRFSNYNPTAPPMSESYSPHRASHSGHVRKYPVLQEQTLYAMPNKEKLSHLRSEPDGASDLLPPPEENNFVFPPPPPMLQDDSEGQYDPPPPDMEWLCKQ